MLTLSFSLLSKVHHHSALIKEKKYKNILTLLYASKTLVCHTFHAFHESTVAWVVTDLTGKLLWSNK